MSILKKMTVDQGWPRKANFIQRLAAKIVAKRLLEKPDATWQVFGKNHEGQHVELYERNTGIAQRVLREMGFDVCEYDLMTENQKHELKQKGVN